MPSRPNLLFLFSDQHTQRIAGCYGDPVAHTPNLDRLAHEGVAFDNVYCPSPLCVPSRMSMLTGRYPFEQECWTNDDYLRSDAATWVHAVGAAGLAALFTVNTVTGAWNWWDTRSQSQGRVLRTIHALTMLSADAAFTYAGAKLSNEAETSAIKRRQHRTVALSAMGVTVVSGFAMKLLNR